MSTLYHIHVSCVRSDHFEEIFWQEGYWSLILTSNLQEVIDVMDRMEDKLRKDTKGSINARDYQAIIAIVKKNNKYDDTITLQQLYQGYPMISVKDLRFDKPDDEVDKYALFHDECYRDDTNDNNGDKNDYSNSDSDSNDTDTSNINVNI